MVIIQLHKKYYTIPVSWNELTGPQLVSVMHVFQRAAINLLDAQVELIRILTGLSAWRCWWIGGAEIEDKLYLTDFLFEENTLTRNVLPEYAGMYGPASDFANLLTCEFIFTEQYYQQYKELATEEVPAMASLNMLVAILYRPAKKNYNKHLNPDGDIREVYNDNLTAHYAQQVARWPMAVKLAILHYYEGCRAALVNNNPDVFGGTGGEVAKYGLWSVMRGVAEKGIHGPINQVENLYVKVFLMELNELVEEARRIDQLTKRTGHG